MIVTKAVVASLAAVATIACLFRFYQLHQQVRLGAQHKRVPSRITLMMSLPPTLIAVYNIIGLLVPGAVLHNNVALLILFIALNLAWFVSSGVIYWWLISTVANALVFNQPNAKVRAKRIMQFMYAVIVVMMIVTTALLIALYTTKWSGIFRIYASVMSLYVLTHIFPYYYSKLMENDIAEHLRSQDDSHLDKRMKRLHTNMAAVRQSFSGTAIYLVDAIFVVMVEFSPYFLPVSFLMGIIFAVGCYRLFPDSVSEEDEKSAPQHPLHSSALSDVMTSTRVGS
jgi:hypothetical protein